VQTQPVADCLWELIWYAWRLHVITTGYESTSAWPVTVSTLWKVNRAIWSEDDTLTKTVNERLCRLLASFLIVITGCCLQSLFCFITILLSRYYRTGVSVYNSTKSVTLTSFTATFLAVLVTGPAWVSRRHNSEQDHVLSWLVRNYRVCKVEGWETNNKHLFMDVGLV